MVVGVVSGACVGAGVAVCFGSAVAVGALGVVVEAEVANGGVPVARINVLTVAVGLMDWARWKGVAPPTNASVATRSATRPATTPPIASARGGRHGPDGGA